MGGWSSHLLRQSDSDQREHKARYRQVRQYTLVSLGQRYEPPKANADALLCLTAEAS